MRKFLKWAAFFCLVSALYVGAAAYHDRSVLREMEKTDDPSGEKDFFPVHTEPNGGIHAPKNLAELTVMSVFADWSQHHFYRMYSMFFNAGRRDSFVAKMQYTPVAYYGIDFISSRETEEGWDVEFQVEVTNLASLLAAAAINMQIPYGAGQVPFRATPHSLRIEELCWVKQTWHLIKGGEAFLIYLGIDEKGAYHGSPNVLHYALEAAGFPVIDGEGQPLSQQNQISRLTVWQVGLETSLGLPEDENERQIKRSDVLHKQAAENLLGLYEKFKAQKPR